MNFDDQTPSHQTSYSCPLTSPVTDLTGCASARLRYSIRLDDYVESSWGYDEYIRVQCSGNGSTWNDVASYVDGDDVSDLSFNWTVHTDNLPAACLTGTATIRFLATGDDSWDIDYWGIDTVSIEP
jgi:hypothetical protein